jgi:hypothetical protein
MALSRPQQEDAMSAGSKAFAQRNALACSVIVCDCNAASRTRSLRG